MGQFGPYSGYRNPAQTAPQPAEGNTCSITILLPTSPVDLYIEGTKIVVKEGVYKVPMVTPSLKGGTYRYTMKIVDKADPSRTRTEIVTGIKAGGNVEVDLTEFKPAAAS